jgi:hypothetical protein
MTAAKRPTAKPWPWPTINGQIIIEPDGVVHYTRRTGNSWYLVKHLRSHGFVTPAMYKLLAMILKGTKKVKYREPQELSSQIAKQIVKRIREEQDVTALKALVIAAQQHSVSPGTFNKWMYPPKRKAKRQP